MEDDTNMAFCIFEKNTVSAPVSSAQAVSSGAAAIFTGRAVVCRPWNQDGLLDDMYDGSHGDVQYVQPYDGKILQLV